MSNRGTSFFSNFCAAVKVKGGFTDPPRLRLSDIFIYCGILPWARKKAPNISAADTLENVLEYGDAELQASFGWFRAPSNWPNRAFASHDYALESNRASS